MEELNKVEKDGSRLKFLLVLTSILNASDSVLVAQQCQCVACN